MKNGKNTHSGHFSETCTGTTSVLVIFYQLVPVQVKLVPVQVKLVPVQPVLVFQFQPVFVFWP